MKTSMKYDGHARPTSIPVPELYLASNFNLLYGLAELCLSVTFHVLISMYPRKSSVFAIDHACPFPKSRAAERETQCSVRNRVETPAKPSSQGDSPAGGI